MDDGFRYVGQRLREQRIRLGMTLEYLGELTSISVSTLSRLESGKRQATLELLVPICQTLGISIDDVVRRPVADPRVRRRQFRRGDVTIVPLTAHQSTFQAFKITYPPTNDVPAPRTHDGFEWLYVLHGKLRLVLDGDEVVLDAGEAAEFDTHIPHSMCATGNSAVEVLSIFNGEGSRIHTHVPD